MPAATLDDFYAISAAGTSAWWWVEFSRRIERYGPSAWKQVMDRSLALGEPIPLRLSQGRKQPDLADGVMHVVTKRFVELMKSIGASGLETSPVVIYDRTDERVLDVSSQRLLLRPGAGPIDTTRGISRLFDGSRKTDPTLTNAFGLYFDPLTWTGQDIFCAGQYRAVLVTRRVRDAIQEAGLQGIVIEHVPEYGRTIRDLLVSGPAPLPGKSFFMPPPKKDESVDP